jgi:hypothetical protein
MANLPCETGVTGDVEDGAALEPIYSNLPRSYKEMAAPMERNA